MPSKSCPLPARLLACCLLFTACGDGFVYKKTVEVPNQSWAYKDTLVFDFEITDTAKIYTLQLDVTHTQGYGFQNLYVQMHTRFPSGKEEKKIVSLELATRSGVWNGKCGGKTCTVEIPLQTKVFFKEKGAYRLAVEQYMRQSPLPGVVRMQLGVGSRQVGED